MPVYAPLDRQLHDPHACVRLNARLDAMTRQKVDGLARHFRQPRAAVLSYIMQWGLSRGQTEPLDRQQLARRRAPSLCLVYPRIASTDLDDLICKN
jgi:hypothetical protein